MITHTNRIIQSTTNITFSLGNQTKNTKTNKKIIQIILFTGKKNKMAYVVVQFHDKRSNPGLIYPTKRKNGNPNRKHRT